MCSDGSQSHQLRFANRNKRLATRYVVAALALGYLAPFTSVTQATAPATTEVCGLIADRYRPLAHAHPGELPIEVLTRSPNSGLHVLWDQLPATAANLVDWAKKRKPPFSISAELNHSLEVYAQSGSGELIKAPGVNFYSFAEPRGSMGCWDSQSFVVQHGIAIPSTTPGEASDDNGNCGVRAVYATIDNSPVAIVQNYSGSPGMKGSLDVWTWNGHGFVTSCKISITYKPHFTNKTLNNWGETCSASDCDHLRHAAFMLAKSAEGDPQALETRSLARLTSQRSEQFSAMKDALEAQSRDPSSNDAFSIPFIDHDRLYIVSVGHFAVGWRDYADWSLIFATLDNGQLTPRGKFAVGTLKGDVERLSITETSNP